MISILKDCFDKIGNRYKVISFAGNRYQCQSYANGKSYFFEPSEISDKPFNYDKTTIDFFKLKAKESPKPAEVVEPVYDFTEEIEPVVEEKPVVVEEKPAKVEKPKQTKKNKDNVKETADDFYADF